MIINSTTKNLSHYQTQRRGQVVTTPASYLDGSRLKSLPEDIKRFEIFLSFASTQSKLLTVSLIKP
jgi:hypothetical protein